MVCNYCGADNRENAKFCEQCGQPLLEIETGSAKAPNVNNKSHTARIAAIIALLAVAFVVLFAFNFFSNSAENKVKGTWTRDNTGIETTDTITYSFTSKGGKNSYSTAEQNYVSNEAEFDWYITKDNELIILWNSTSCIKYTWNPDYNNYNLSSNEYNWYIKGNRMYLSSTAAEKGYYVYVK